MARTRVTAGPPARPSRPAEPVAGPPAAGPLPWSIVLGFAAVVVVTRVVAWFSLHHAAEDAYITFRYAQNWAHGLGPVYNAGERVWGFSSPLWTAMLALASAAHADLLGAARAFSLVADLVALVLGMRLLESHSRLAALAYGVFFATFPYVAAMSALGMESNLFWCLLVVAAATLRRSWAASGAALAGLALVRPEGAATAVVMALWARNGARALGAATSLAVWLGFGIWYRQLVPQSVVAKALVYGFGRISNGRVWLDWALPTWWGKDALNMEQAHLFPMAIVILPGLVAGVIALWRQWRSPLAALAAAGLGLTLGYTVLGVTYFYWYLMVPMLTVVACTGIGLATLGLPRAFWWATCAFVVTDWSHFTGVYGNRLEIEHETFGKAASVVQADVHTHPLPQGRTPVIALEPIGWIGWETGFRVVDEVGLVSPWVAFRRNDGPGWYTDLVRREHPDYVVMRANIYIGGESYAGAGRPFRDSREQETTLSQYVPIYPEMGAQLDPGDLVVLRRRAAP